MFVSITKYRNKRKGKHTKGNHDPDKVHEEIINPKIIPFRSTVRYTMDIVVKQARHIVQCIPIQMAHADDELEWMAQGMLGKGQVCHPVAQRAPEKLFNHVQPTWPAKSKLV